MQPSIKKIIGGGTAWLATTTIFLKVVSFFFLVMVLNRLTVFEYGVAELVLTTVPLLSFLQLSGLSPTVIADMSRERASGNYSRMKGLLLSYLKIQLVLAFLAWAIVFFGANALAVWFGKGSTVQFFQIVSFLFLLSPLRTIFQTLQTVFLEFRLWSLYTFLEEISKLIFVAVFFFVFDFRIYGLLLGVVLSQALALILISYSVVTLTRSLWKADQEHFSLFHFLRNHGKWAVFSNYLGTFGKNIRPWLIAAFLGPQAVGIYAVAQGLIGHVVSLMPLDVVVRPLLPQYLHTKERFYALVTKAVKYELAGYFVLSVASAIGVPLLIDWFFPQYVLAIGLFHIMLFMLISSAFDSIFTGVFLALQAQRSLFFASAYKLVLVIIFFPICMYYFGILGIGYATIALNSLYVWERYRKLKKLMPGFTLRLHDLVTADEFDRVILRQFVGFFMRMPIIGNLARPWLKI